MATVNIKIKLESEDSGGEIDVARERFESALHHLLHKDDISDSENESDSDSKSKLFGKLSFSGSRCSNTEINSLTSSSRPPRKRRRKEVELRDAGFHHTFVMRMFDRSVDLAQFDDSSPLFPICRAWMLNQPHNSNLNVKQEPSSPITDLLLNNNDTGEDSDTSEAVSDSMPPNINRLPNPHLWPLENLKKDPRIPEILPSSAEKLIYINEDATIPSSVLLTEHLSRWRDIRSTWRNTGQLCDQRYAQSYSILKAMFDRAHEG